MEAIGGNTRKPTKLELSRFKNQRGVNIRKWYKDSDGKLSPTRQGIWLNQVEYMFIQEVITTKHTDIISFFNATENFTANLSIESSAIIGKSFDIESENGETTVIIDSMRNRQFTNANLPTLGTTIACVYQTMIDLGYDEQDINQFLVQMDKNIRVAQWNK